jgi:hypothetical protein
MAPASTVVVVGAVYMGVRGVVEVVVTVRGTVLLEVAEVAGTVEVVGPAAMVEAGPPVSDWTVPQAPSRNAAAQRTRSRRVATGSS